MGSYQTLWRGRLQHKYHYCSCCGVRYPLSMLTWQTRDLGSGLYCPQCVDTRVGPQRDAERTRMENIAAQSTTEDQPDRMLTEGALTIDDEVEFIP